MKRLLYPFTEWCSYANSEVFTSKKNERGYNKDKGGKTVTSRNKPIKTETLRKETTQGTKGDTDDVPTEGLGREVGTSANIRKSWHKTSRGTGEWECSLLVGG